MLCHDAQLNTLDATIGKMLREGAQVDLTENQLGAGGRKLRLLMAAPQRAQNAG
jgi:heat shock protein HslJ